MNQRLLYGKQLSTGGLQVISVRSILNNHPCRYSQQIMDGGVTFVNSYTCLYN